MSDWKTAFRSFYYQQADAPDDLCLPPCDTCMLVIDIQNTYLKVPDDPLEAARWKPFFDRMNATVIPNTVTLVDWARQTGVEVIFARIACQTEDGRDRSLSQKKPGFNYLLLPKDREDSHMVTQLTPQGDEITVLKTTDSALTGTNLRLILHNIGIRNVVVVEDCCAAATDELHRHELEIINMIYCHVVQSEDVFATSA